MQLCIHVFIYLSICQHICPNENVSISLCIVVDLHLFICVSLHLFRYLNICLTLFRIKSSYTFRYVYKYINVYLLHIFITILFLIHQCNYFYWCQGASLHPIYLVISLHMYLLSFASIYLSICLYLLSLFVIQFLATVTTVAPSSSSSQPSS